jgi:hypothetical protein
MNQTATRQDYPANRLSHPFFFEETLSQAFYSVPPCTSGARPLVFGSTAALSSELLSKGALYVHNSLA